MIIGCYTLNLYCEVPECTEEMPWEYAGRTGGSCRQQARRQGWQLMLVYGVCVCLGCGKKGRRVQDYVK